MPLSHIPNTATVSHAWNMLEDDFGNCLGRQAITVLSVAASPWKVRVLGLSHLALNPVS